MASFGHAVVIWRRWVCAHCRLRCEWNEAAWGRVYKLTDLQAHSKTDKRLLDSVSHIMQFNHYYLCFQVNVLVRNMTIAPLRESFGEL